MEVWSCSEGVEQSGAPREKARVTDQRVDGEELVRERNDRRPGDVSPRAVGSVVSEPRDGQECVYTRMPGPYLTFPPGLFSLPLRYVRPNPSFTTRPYQSVRYAHSYKPFPPPHKVEEEIVCNRW